MPLVVVLLVLQAGLWLVSAIGVLGFARAAGAAGMFGSELVALGGSATLLALAELAPAFTPGGTITAGNASQLSDGAAATVVMRAERAEMLGVEPLAEILANGMCAERFEYLHTVPAIAMQNALKRAGKDVHDLGLLEINEAFASVSLNAARMLGVDDSIVNVNGGAVALGHPIGASGARLVLTLALEMRRRGVDLGGATLCGGGGQGDALIIKRIA